MMNRQQFKSDKDLEKARKTNQFHRQENLHEVVHVIHIRLVKWLPWTFGGLFIAHLFHPLYDTWIDTTQLDRALYVVGGILLNTVLSSKISPLTPPS